MCETDVISARLLCNGDIIGLVQEKMDSEQCEDNAVDENMECNYVEDISANDTAEENTDRSDTTVYDTTVILKYINELDSIVSNIQVR